MMNRGKKDHFHAGFSHENTRHNNNFNSAHIGPTDLYFLQVLGRIH